ncbi:potassium channel, subfamily K, member 7 [Pholidichthys leucotaenia]
MARLLSFMEPLLQRNPLTCLLLCYLLFVLLGGLVFTVTEKPVEEELRAQVEELRRSFLEEHPCVGDEELREVLGKALSAHRGHVAVLKAEADERHYDFISSLYFVIVTVTTTGSDSYTPRSDEAKLFLIFYCTLGIPLTLLLLTLASHLLLLPVVTRGPIHHLQSRWGLPYARAALVHAALLSILVVALLFFLPALLVSTLEPDWTYLDALFFCFVALSTIGEGGRELGRSWGPAARETLELLTTCYLLVGLVVIITYKDTVLQVPRVCAVIRLLSGPQCAELEGFHLDELTEDEENQEEEPRYSQSVCTVSSTPLEQMNHRPGLH